MEDLALWIVLAPFAGILGGMLLLIRSHRAQWVGNDCDMAGCKRWGRPTFRCYKCKKVNVYYCWSCQWLILDNLRQIGHEVTMCVPCAKAEHS